MTCQCPDHDCSGIAAFWIHSDRARRQLCRDCYTAAHGWQWERLSRQREPWPEEDFEDDDTIWMDDQAMIDHQLSEDRWEGRA